MSAPVTRPKLRLINPRSPLSAVAMPEIIRRMTFSRRAIFMPLNLAICAAAAPPPWDVEIIDENVADAPHIPSASGITAVGIGAMTTQAFRAYELADAYRALGVKVILGGIHPSLLPHEASLHADIVCIGDAESTLPHALNDLLANRHKPIYDWQHYPEAPMATPRKDLLNPADYLVFNPIQTTRGCPHNCNFCTVPKVFGRKFRRRSIPAIIEEIRQAKQAGSSTFIFSDDDFAGNHEWAMELCHAMQPLKIRWASQCDILVARSDTLLRAMRESGCVGLLLGLESPRPDILAAAGKKYARADQYLQNIAKIQSHRISLWGSFIFGFDGNTWKHCMDAVRFGQRAKLAMSIFTILTPFPGTDIFDQYQRQGRILTTDWNRYNGGSVVFRPTHITPDELRHAQMSAFFEFYNIRSAARRLGLLPVKKFGWMVNLAISRGFKYYYDKKARPLPRFADFLAGDSSLRIAACRGDISPALCGWA